MRTRRWSVALTKGRGPDQCSFDIVTPSISTAFLTARVSILAISRADPTDPGSSATVTLAVEPQILVGILKSLTVNPAEVSQGSTSNGLVTLERPVPTDTTVALAALDPQLPGGGTIPTSSNTSSLVTLPSSITIAAGHIQGQIAIRAAQSSLHGGKRTVTIMAGAVATWTRKLTIDF